MEADVVVMDLKSTPAIEFRLRSCNSFEEMLFVQMTMGDDRAIRETWIAGKLAHQRVDSDRAAPSPGKNY